MAYENEPNNDLFVTEDMQQMLFDQMRRNLEYHQEQIDKLVDDSGLERKQFDDLMIAYVAMGIATKESIPFNDAMSRIVTPKKKEKKKQDE